MSITNLKDLRKNSGADKLRQMMEEQTKSANSYKDENEGFWEPTVDEAGNGYAIIRFLPAPKGEELPFVKVWHHSFKGPGGWYINKSRTTLGQSEADPAGEMNKRLWDSGFESDKKLVSEGKNATKRKLNYISNIYVVKDEKNPENNGKVFLFKYGKKIYDKLYSATKPQFSDDEVVSPFDFWEGANFKLKIRNVEGYRNYDLSSFEKVSTFMNDDEAKMDAVWSQCRSLTKFIDPSSFKSYDDLRKQLLKVMGPVVGSGVATVTGITTEMPTETREAPKPPRSEVVPPTEAPSRPMPTPAAEKAPWDDDDDLSKEMEAFKNRFKS